MLLCLKNERLRTHKWTQAIERDQCVILLSEQRTRRQDRLAYRNII